MPENRKKSTLRRLLSAAPYLSERRTDFAVIALLLCLGVFHIVTVQRLESYSPDSSVYITLAHNLLKTGRYVFNYKAHTVFPPGFPAILACITMLTGGAGYDVYIRYIPAFGALGLIVWYLLLKREAGRFCAGASCLLIATSLPFYGFVTRIVLSDMAFFLVSGLALWCVLSLECGTGSRTVRALLFIGAILFTAVAVSIRSAGVALPLGMLVRPLFHHGPRTRSAARAGICAAMAGLFVFGLWMAWSKRWEELEYPGQHMSSYGSMMLVRDGHQPELGKASPGQMLLRILTNLPPESSQLGGLATRIGSTAPLWISPLTLIPLVLLLAGIVASAKSSRGTLLAAYFVCYWAACLLWPFGEDALRFMLPVAPLALVFMWRGLSSWVDLARIRSAEKLGVAAAVSAALAGAAAVSHSPGAQGRASLAFWGVGSLMLALLAFSARRAGVARADGVLKGLAGVPGWSVGLTGLLVLLCAIGLVQQTLAARTNLTPDPSVFWHHPTVDCAAWLGTAADGVVMSGEPEILHRLTGRRIAAFPISSNPQLIMTAALRGGVRYLVVNARVKYEYFLPAEEDRFQQIERAYPDAFRLVHTGPGYRLFELRR